jgi:hypothetical protein
MSLASVHIQLAIETLLSAHSSTCMYRANGHPTYMESVPANLEKAIRSINEAMVDAREELSGQPRGITKG